MRLKTVILMSCLAVVPFLCYGCGGGEYADLERFTKRYLGVIQDYADAMEQAEDAIAVAAAIDRREAGLERLLAERKTVMEKYPEFFIDGYEDLTETAMRAESNMQEAARLLHHATIKLHQYQSAPEVQEALARLVREWQ